MTDDERMDAVRQALGRDGIAAERLDISPLRGKAGTAVYVSDHGAEFGGWYYVDDASGLVYQMPSAAPTAPAFENRLPQPYHREALRVGKGDPWPDKS